MALLREQMIEDVMQDKLAADSGVHRAKESTSPTTAAGMNVRPWFVLAIICIPVFVGSLDLTVVSAFLPELIIQLGLPGDSGLSDASWILSGYLLAYTISLSFVGRLSDLVGRRLVYVISLLVFIGGSVLVATANQAPADVLGALYGALNIEMEANYIHLHGIIIGRFIQALGAGALVPVSLALVGDMFPEGKRARPLGLVAAVDTLGWVMGSLYGGLFVQIMPWQGLFWINVPLTLFALGMTLWALRGVPQVKVNGRFDFSGTALIVLALACLNIGLGANVDTATLTSLDDLEPLPEYALPVLTLGLFSFISFIFVELRAHDPLINLKMFLKRNISAASVVNLLVGYILFIGMVSVPVLVNLLSVQQGGFASLTDAALRVGLLLSTLTIPMALAAFLGGLLSNRFGMRATVIFGLLLAVGGYISIWQTWHLHTSYIEIGIQMAVIGTGIGLTFSPVSTAIIDSAEQEDRGVASALVIMLRLVGMTVSVSTLTMFATYRLQQLSVILAEKVESLSPFNVLQQVVETVMEGGDLMEALMGAFMPPGVTPADTVRILADMGMIGAIIAGIAIIPALLLRNKPTNA